MRTVLVATLRRERGRSVTLKVNYRTSQQIRQMADRLLPRTVRDVDGLEEDRRGTVSVFDHIAPREIAIFVRSAEQLPRARSIAETAGLSFRTATISRYDEDKALVGIMHLAKGLEFRAVAVVACDEDVLPLAARVADVADAFELDEVIATER